MAPFGPSEHGGARNLLRLIIVINLAIGIVTLWSVKAFNDAMAQSQLNIVQKVAELRNDVGNIKTDVHRELEAFTKEGQQRIEQNNDNTIQTKAAVDALEQELHAYTMHTEDLFARAQQDRDAQKKQMDKVVDYSKQSKAASQAVHAKVSQKILTGQEAEAVRRQQVLAEKKLQQAEKIRQSKHPAVVKFWPWQQ